MPWVTARRFHDSLVQYEIGDEVPQRISDRTNLRAKFLEFRATVPEAEVKKPRGRPPKIDPQVVPISAPPKKELIAISNISIGQIKKLIVKEKSLAVLEAMLVTESKGNKRKGAIAVIEARIDKLRKD